MEELLQLIGLFLKKHMQLLLDLLKLRKVFSCFIIGVTFLFHLFIFLFYLFINSVDMINFSWEYYKHSHWYYAYIFQSIVECFHLEAD